MIMIMIMIKVATGKGTACIAIPDLHTLAQLTIIVIYTVNLESNK